MTLPYVAFSFLEPNEVARVCDGVVEQCGPRHWEKQHPDGPVARLLAAQRNILHACAEIATEGAFVLGLDVSECNWVYGKLLEYRPGSGHAHFHDDLGVGSAEAERAFLANGSLAPWQLEEIKGRRLNVSLQLTPETDYVGGDLQFVADDGSIVSAPRAQGTAVVFESGRKHRVTRLESGTRLVIAAQIGRSPRGEQGAGTFEPGTGKSVTDKASLVKNVPTMPV